MNPLFLILTALFVGASCGVFAAFFAFCLEEGNILHFYSSFLDKYFSALPEERLESPSLPKAKRFFNRLLLFLYKPLGGCIFCLNFWLTLAFFAATRSCFLLPWWTILPVIGASYASLVWLNRLKD